MGNEKLTPEEYQALLRLEGRTGAHLEQHLRELSPEERSAAARAVCKVAMILRIHGAAGLQPPG